MVNLAASFPAEGNTFVSSMDEASLIRAAQHGDQGAFEQLVRAYDRGVLRLALNLLRNPEDAYDIYQEAFLRVYRNLHKFRFDCSFQTWLYRIVTNLCFDLLRKKKVRKEDLPSVDGSGVDRLSNMPDAAPYRDPQRQVLGKELAGRIESALSELTPRERLVFELRHFQGLRLKEIGDLLECSEEAAKNCLFRATQKMRQALGDLV